MSTKPYNPAKQPRDRRYNINLTEAESELVEALAKITGMAPAVILRELSVKQALTVLLNDEDSILDKVLSTGAEKHRERS
jgi:hypothetical protein